MEIEKTIKANGNPIKYHTEKTNKEETRITTINEKQKI